MPKLYRLSGRQVIYSLEQLEFVQVRQRGSHVVLRKEVAGGHIGCVVHFTHNWPSIPGEAS